MFHDVPDLVRETASVLGVGATRDEEGVLSLTSGGLNVKISDWDDVIREEINADGEVEIFERSYPAHISIEFNLPGASGSLSLESEQEDEFGLEWSPLAGSGRTPSLDISLDHIERLWEGPHRCASDTGLLSQLPVQSVRPLWKWDSQVGFGVVREYLESLSHDSGPSGDYVRVVLLAFYIFEKEETSYYGA